MMVYREEIRDPAVMWVAWPLYPFTAGCAAMFFYQLFVGPLGEDPVPTWFWGLFALIALGAIFLLKNLTRLVVELTDEHLIVGFGTTRSKVSWDRVVVREEGRSVLAYWDIGLRLVRIKGRWVKAYVPGVRAKRVVVELRGGRIRELVFATRDPDGVIELIGSRIKRESLGS